MKTSIKSGKKDFDTVKTFRSIKEKISKEIKGLSYEELMDYFERTRLKETSPDQR
ncbi:MAG: hypothetical protein LBP72_00505 [Dysgonamonadaceae bacterium]|jgi:hypothetical protein|nr:hypothetical protein [Dysgonamonadaceae bacterium]